MAIYSLSTKPISRSGGRSAVAAASYRSGSELADERTGVVHDYTRKRGVEHAEIVTRDGVPAPERESLWNQAEAAEKRKDARVAREYLVALPHELDADQRLTLARELAGELSERYGVAVDMAIHAPDREGDQRNHHAHLLATTRAYGHDGLGEKVAIEWSDKKRRDAGLERGADEVKLIRQRWETMTNAALERAEVAERVDCRSLSDQGINRVPQIHVGPMGTEMQRRGTPELSDRATLNLEIQATNRQLHQLQERAARRAAEREALDEDVRATIAAVDAERAAEARERADLEALAAELPDPSQEAPQQPEPQAEAPQRPRTKAEVFKAAADRITARRAAEARERRDKGLPLTDRQRDSLEEQAPQRRQEPPQAPPAPSAAVQRIDAQIDATRRELTPARERLADIEEQLLDVQLELKPAAQERDRTSEAAQVAAQGVASAQAELDGIKGWFKGGQRREATQRLDAAQGRHQSAQEAAQAAQARHASLSRQYGELREQAAPARRQVEQLETEYQGLQQQRTAQIEREQRPEPRQEAPQRQGDAWDREAGQERSQEPQRDAWADERGQAQEGPELG